MHRSILLLPVLALFAPVQAAEFAVLSNGFRVLAERHEVQDGIVRLFGQAGVTELAAAQVVAFEQEEVSPAAVAAALPSLNTAVPASASFAPKLTPQELVHRAALKNGLPPAFVQSVARAESGLHSQAISPKGAIGIMQLMPGTAASLSADPHDPAQNAEAGARLLAQLLVKYDGDSQLALAAYNAGEGAVAKYKGVPPYRETRDYVRKVLRRYEQTR